MKKISAILLAIIVAALSLNAGLAYHYCGGSLAEVKLVLGYGEAGCGMEGDGEEEPCQAHDALTSATCCQNHLEKIGSDDYQLLKKPLDINIYSTLSTLPVKKNLWRFDTTARKVIFIKPPPELTAVSLPLIQVFLI